LRRRKAIWVGVALVMSLCLSVLTRGDDALPQVAVTYGLKVISLQRQFSAKPDGITIYVLGDANVAKAFQTQVNQTIGAMKVAKVLSGDELPSERPDVLFIGDKDKVDQAVLYTRQYKVLSMARNEKLLPRGVTLVVSANREGDTQISMNMSGALLEGVQVNPATLKVVRVAK
jgi:hypothetical protein